MLDMKEFGRRIAEERKRLNMTQMQLADALQLSFQAVSSWERGLTMPDVAKLPEIASLFGVSMDRLFGLEPKKEAKKMRRLAKPRKISQTHDSSASSPSNRRAARLLRELSAIESCCPKVRMMTDMLLKEGLSCETCRFKCGLLS